MAATISSAVRRDRRARAAGPRGNPDAPLQLLVANLDSSDYLDASRSAAFSTAA